VDHWGTRSAPAKSIFFCSLVRTLSRVLICGCYLCSSRSIHHLQLLPITIQSSSAEISSFISTSFHIRVGLCLKKQSSYDAFCCFLNLFTSEVQAPNYVQISPTMKLSIIQMLVLALHAFIFSAFAAPTPSDMDTMNITSADIAAAEM
jgi:hypothetical protein